MEEKTSILIVDDDLGMTETLFDILTDKEYKVDVANEGYTAIELVNKNDYSIAFIDIKMPGINGVETFKKIKHIRPFLKVIMMTAYSVEDLAKEAIKEGVYGIIYKPLNINELFNFIRNIEKKSIILIVDDDTNFCQTFKDLLEEMNYKITVKYSGEQAIKYVKENDIDIIFIDVKMPVLNGLELYHSIKKINPKITGIMITGFYDEEKIRNQIEEAFKNNLYACLYKPLKSEIIVPLMDEIHKLGLKSDEISQLGDRNK